MKSVVLHPELRGNKFFLAIPSFFRYIYGAVGINSLAALSPSDILYNPLPFYHTAGGMLAIGQGLIFGLSLAIRRKFSASNYWKDCRRYNCNVRARTIFVAL